MNFMNRKSAFVNRYRRNSDSFSARSTIIWRCGLSLCPKDEGYLESPFSKRRRDNSKTTRIAYKERKQPWKQRIDRRTDRSILLYLLHNSNSNIRKPKKCYRQSNSQWHAMDSPFFHLEKFAAANHISLPPQFTQLAFVASVFTQVYMISSTIRFQWYKT